LHIYVSFFGFRFLVSVLERHALIALAAVTLHDAMQLAHLSKPRSGAKYSPISYFLPTIGSYLSLDWEALGPLD
jgi:hypothetical protein